MTHGQGTVDLLKLLQKHPDGLSLLEIKKTLPLMASGSGIHSMVEKQYLDKFKPGPGKLRKNIIYKITSKGLKLFKYYENNPDKIMKTRVYKKRAKQPVIEPQLYHDPIAQQYIEDMARPVAWSSSLNSTLRDIYLMTQKIIDTDDIPKGESDLDKHNFKHFQKIVKINKVTNINQS